MMKPAGMGSRLARRAFRVETYKENAAPKRRVSLNPMLAAG
jgi:hypothetical protein